MKCNLLILILSFLITYSLIFCDEFIHKSKDPKYKDCGSETGYMINASANGCSTQAKRCVFKKGTTAIFESHFVSQTYSKSATVKIWGKVLKLKIPFSINPKNACGNWNVTCPLKKNQHNHLQIKFPVKQSYPKFKTTIRMALYDDNKKKIICLKIPVKIID